MGRTTCGLEGVDALLRIRRFLEIRVPVDSTPDESGLRISAKELGSLSRSNGAHLALDQFLRD